MNDDKFSLKARRTTRIPLRIPVHLVVQEIDGRTRTLDGWTMIVNVHGARIECKRPFALHEEVLLQVPSSGKVQKGRVVWSGSEANKNGYYEFGLEMESPENLWGVGFPPSDWSTNRAAAAAELADPPIAIAPGVVSPASDLPSMQELCPAEITAQTHAVEPVDQPVFANEPTAPVDLTPSRVESSLPMSEGLPPIVNLTAELSEWETVRNEQPSSVSPLDNALWQQPDGAMGTGRHLPWPDSGARDHEVLASSPGPVGLATAYLGLRQPENGSAAPAVPPRGISASSGEGTAATDRLSAIFNELVESALQARLLGLAERLGARVEARIAETEAAALARMEQQILRAVSSQSERLEKHAVEIVADQQQLLEQNVQKFLQNVEASAIYRQQQFLENSRRVMRNEVTEVIKSSKAQFQQETSELASTAWTSLRQSLDQELPSIEKQFAEQCRTQAEHLLADQMEELTRRCCDRIQEADQSMTQCMERAVEENTTRFVARFEARSELLRAESCSQLERQIEQTSNQARQAFLRHIVTELNQRQQLWLQQAQKDLNDLAEQNLQRTRQSLAQLMKELGGALIRGAYQKVGESEEVSSGCNGQDDVQETDRLAENEGCYNLLNTGGM